MHKHILLFSPLFLLSSHPLVQPVQQPRSKPHWRSWHIPRPNQMSHYLSRSPIIMFLFCSQLTLRWYESLQRTALTWLSLLSNWALRAHWSCPALYRSPQPQAAHYWLRPSCLSEMFRWKLPGGRNPVCVSTMFGGNIVEFIFFPML